MDAAPSARDADDTVAPPCESHRDDDTFRNAPELVVRSFVSRQAARARVDIVVRSFDELLVSRNDIVRRRMIWCQNKHIYIHHNDLIMAHTRVNSLFYNCA